MRLAWDQSKKYHFESSDAYLEEDPVTRCIEITRMEMNVAVVKQLSGGRSSLLALFADEHDAAEYINWLYRTRPLT